MHPHHPPTPPVTPLVDDPADGGDLQRAKVLRALDTAAIPYAIRKGPVMTEGVYRDPGARRTGDLDVLLRRETLPAFEQVVDGLGYRQGHQSRDGERVVPFDRGTRLFWQVNLSNVALPYIKPAHRDDVELFILDTCFSLFQQSSGIAADSGDFLDRAVATTLYGEPSRMLDPADQLLDACVQIHVEATTLYYIEIGKDLTVLKFLDLALLFAEADEPALHALAERADRYGCLPSVRYALHHTRQLYPEAVPAQLVARLGVADREFIAGYDEYGAFDGEARRWETGFTERLFAPGNSRSAGIRSSVP
ncbi:nucleotidyltransferase family protein, partial [Streptomyces sp. FH025]|uniref:nucleotidyltransferase family protein n=1 Tax=Streptomyces sp. FH025 TaxID=2815937 RepID=UPI001A9E5EA7